MNNETIYTIYKTTNLINNKIYIGQHITQDIENDEYYGSGTIIKSALKKYGKENFKKEIIFQYDNFEEMNDKEIELVNEEFVLRKDTYNILLGGIQNRAEGYVACKHIDNWDDVRYINKNDDRYGITYVPCATGIAKSEKSKENSSKAISKLWESGHYDDMQYDREGEKNSFYGKHHSDEAKSKISKANKGRLKGIPRPDEIRRKISESKTGMKFKIVTCPHCGKQGGGGNMTRYHFDNCKLKPE